MWGESKQNKFLSVKILLSKNIPVTFNNSFERFEPRTYGSQNQCLITLSYDNIKTIPIPQNIHNTIYLSINSLV